MTYTEIYIDDESIDLGGDVTTCPITYSLIDIKNLNNRSGSKTKTVSVPRTAKNEKIFGCAFDINASNSFDKYAPHRVRIEESTEVIFDGLCKLTRVTDGKIEFFCYAEISAFKGISGTLTLQDLRLNDLDHPYDVSIYDTWNGVYPTYVAPDYIYPVIDYGNFWTRDIADPETIDVYVVDLYPAVFLERIIRQICLDNGYTLVTSFFDDPQLSKLCIPFTNKDFVHSKEYLTQTKGFEGYTSSNSPYGIPYPVASYNLPIVTEVFDPLDQWHQANREYTADAAQRAAVRFRGFINFTGSGHNTSDIVFNFIVEKYTALTATWSEVNKYPMSFTGNIQYVDWTNNVNLASGDKIRFRLERLVAGGLTKEALVYAENVQITPQPVTGVEIQEGETVQLAPNLPNIKQIDLFAWCYKMFNWVIDVDASAGVISIESYSPYYISGDVIDMSNKLNLSIDPQIDYDNSQISRKYDFQYTLDEGDYYLMLQNGIDVSETGINYGDGKLYLTEQGDATMIGKVGFSPTVIVKSFINSLEIPTMISMDGGIVYTPVLSTDHEPRMLIYGGLVDVTTLTNGTYSAIVTDDGNKSAIPFVYFQKRQYNDPDIDAYSQNLSFNLNGTSAISIGPVVWSSGTLVDRFYLQTIKDLSTSALVTAYFNLDASDLSSLDFSAKWFIDYFESQFKLNRIIDYQPGRLAPTRVELIKISAYINPRQLDTF